MLIAITRTDGKVSIMRLVDGEDVSDHLARWERSGTDDAPLKLVSWREIEANQIPIDRAFRNASIDTGTFEVDMPRARDIHRAMLRALRAPILQQLDIDYIRADEEADPAAKAEIAAKKQALRDVTSDPAIEKAMTPQDLAKVIPKVLRSDK